MRRAGLFEATNVPFMMQNVGGLVTLAFVVHMAAAFDREALERLKAATPAPLPKALIRIARPGGPTSYARPPLQRHPALTPTDVPGIGEGYDLPVDQDYWYDDGSKEFADLWARTETQLVHEG